MPSKDEIPSKGELQAYKGAEVAKIFPLYGTAPFKGVLHVWPVVCYLPLPIALLHDGSGQFKAVWYARCLHLFCLVWQAHMLPEHELAPIFPPILI
jgi:hypothetical protein